MNDPIPSPENTSPDYRVRTRYEHTCGQIIWVVELPHGFACFAELRPVLPPPITTCPHCGAELTRATLTQRQRGGT